MKHAVAVTAALAGLCAASLYFAEVIDSRRAEPVPVAVNTKFNPAEVAAESPAAERLPSFRLVGVLVQEDGSTALLEVDGQPARSFREGDAITAAWTLAKVRPEFVTVTGAEKSVRVGLSGGVGAWNKSAAASTPAPSAMTPMAEAPPFVPLEVARERNRPFLEAINARTGGS
jgi:hypothetical protein